MGSWAGFGIKSLSSLLWCQRRGMEADGRKRERKGGGDPQIKCRMTPITASQWWKLPPFTYEYEVRVRTSTSTSIADAVRLGWVGLAAERESRAPLFKIKPVFWLITLMQHKFRHTEVCARECVLWNFSPWIADRPALFTAASLHIKSFW